MDQASLISNVTHWMYGAACGGAYGVVAGSLKSHHTWWGLPFGAGVWSTSYVVLPTARVYDPIWTYSPGVLAKDLSAHLAYGFATAGAFAAAGRTGREKLDDRLGQVVGSRQHRVGPTLAHRAGSSPSSCPPGDQFVPALS